MTQRFEPFEQLISECEKQVDGNNTTSASSEDLQCFWGMTRLQIDDVEKTFHELDALRENSWKVDSVEKEPEASPPPKVRQCAKT